MMRTKMSNRFANIKTAKDLEKTIVPSHTLVDAGLGLVKRMKSVLSLPGRAPRETE